MASSPLAPMLLNVLFALSFIISVLNAAPTSSTTDSGTIISPASGTQIAPGAAFNFDYRSRADYGVSSYNYTVLLLASLPSSLAPTDAFSSGHFFGRFAEANYPGNPNPPNPPPAQLIMPDFSKNPGGFGVGCPDSNATFYLMVLEEYGNGQASVGLRMGLAVNTIIYNGTSSH